MIGVSKRFGTNQALEDVSLSVEQGEISAIVGENGAGKTTLMRILYGALQPDQGAIRLHGQDVRFARSADAIRARIGMVSQHYSVIPELTCLQNLMLGAEPGFMLGGAASERRASELARSMNFGFDWKALAATLTPAGAQKLEILKLLWRDAEVLILDEPTAMLSPADGEALFGSLRLLTGQGRTVLLVTHRLPEVIDHCARVAVLRCGRRVAEKPVSETDSHELAELVVGHSIAISERRGRSFSQPLLSVRDLSVRGERGDVALKGASFEIRSGEILGIAGVDGNGQRELFQALIGTVSTLSGRVELGPVDLLAKTASERIALGVRIIPEDRHAEGTVEDWSLEENAALGLQRLTPFARRGAIDARARRQAAERIADRFATKHAGLDAPMRTLSGGNQQRFVAARALAIRPKLILAFQPTRGLDIDGAQQVYSAIRSECESGAAALVVSFDLDELLEQCDRVIAICGGVICEPSDGQEKDRAAIGRLMVGAA